MHLSKVAGIIVLQWPNDDLKSGIMCIEWYHHVADLTKWQIPSVISDQDDVKKWNCEKERSWYVPKNPIHVIEHPLAQTVVIYFVIIPTEYIIRLGTLLIAIDMKWSNRKRASVRVQELITAETSTMSPSSWKITIGWIQKPFQTIQTSLWITQFSSLLLACLTLVSSICMMLAWQSAMLSLM